jgi:SnoaL-like domain
VQRLVDIEEIKQLKARYCRLIDTGRLEEWAELFTSEVRFETPSTGGERVGVGAWLEYVRGRLRGGVSAHHCHTPEIDITGPTSATGVWAMADVVRHVKDDGGEVTIRGSGHYLETYAKEGTEWRIASLKLSRLILETVETS